MKSNNITPGHLERRAVVYVRQSSADQVKNCLESQKRQYALADQAREMGFPDVEVIDEDLGRSGASTHNRGGFRKLVAAVSLKEVGAVFSAEASRLARNNKDWAQLVDLCSLTETLIIDYDGVYDPSLLNDRLLLGLKGTMSEYELGLMRQRAQGALKQMASRGELVTSLPVGYVKDGKHKIAMEPDERVRQALSLVFTKFRELESVRQVLLWFRQEGIRLPANRYTPEGWVNEWKLPVYNTVLHILKNPIYAGVYAYGKTATYTKIVDGHAVKVHGKHLPRKEWEVFIPNHHKGYMTLAEWERNQKVIEDNTQSKSHYTKGSVRSGKSLLSGLLRCRRCGRKLHVCYSGTKGRVPRYGCRGANLNHGTGKCLSFGGLAVDQAVEREVLDALKPEAIRASLESREEFGARESEHLRALELSLEQAEYEAERAYRQYDAVEPENRLVARELEVILNERLAEAERLRKEVKEMPESEVLSEDQIDEILSLAEAFPSVWHDEKIEMQHKKRLVRILIEEIYVDVDDGNSTVELTIRWAGGYHTELEVRKNRTGEHRYRTDRDVVELVGDLARVSPDHQIARTLNMLGLKTARGLTWTEGRLRGLRSYKEIPAYSEKRKEEEGWLNMQEAARYLGVSPMSVKRLLERGTLKGKQVVPHAPWVINKSDLDTEEVRTVVCDIKSGKGTVRRDDSGQKSFDFAVS